MKKAWETKQLGELCEFQRGLTYTKGDEVETSNNVVLRATNIHLETNLLDFTELKFINDKVGVPNNKKVKKDSLLICTASGSKSHLGKVAYIDDDYGYAFGGFMGMITPSSGLMPKYLFHLMTSAAYKDFIGALSDGANINNLKFDDLKRFQVPHPDPNEQHRIVGILDKAFEGLATAKTNAEKNLKNARAIFESELNAVFTQKGDDWVERTFEEIIQSNVIGLTKSIREQGENLQYPYVKMNNITRDNRFDFSSFVSVNATADEVSRFRLQEGDLIFNTRNSVELVGKACLFESGSNDVVLFNNNIMRIRFKSGIDPRFVLFSFSSNSVAEELNALKSGTTNVAAIYYKNLRDLAIPLAPLETQRAVALKLRHLREETQRLEGIYQRKLERLDALKKSLLHHAFTSQL